MVRPASAVEDFEDPALPKLVRDLFETCHAAPGLGLAAPQIGVSRRVAVVDLSAGREASKELVLINPRILDAEGLVRDEEGCLSFPDLVEIVERPERVRLEAFDLAGRLLVYEAEELLARAFCHEVDHLDGLLFTDRLSPFRRRRVLRRAARKRQRGDW